MRILLLGFDESKVSEDGTSVGLPLATSLNVMAHKVAQKFWLYQKLGKSTKDL